MALSGFTLVRNATLLDFPLEQSIASILPVVDELIVNVGDSDDDTIDRVRAIGDPRIRIIESTWDPALGTAMLAVETQRAMDACRFPWGLYIQADEVLADGGAQRIAELIARHDSNPRFEGVVVDYLHFYGGFDTIASNRKWYRREVRALRLDPAYAMHSYRDAQGFRAGPRNRPVRAIRSGVSMYHYGWARPAWALQAKRAADSEMIPALRDVGDRPLLPGISGIRQYAGSHPQAAARWIAARRTDERLIAPLDPNLRPWRFVVTEWLEAAFGWRPFEYRNYRLMRP